MDAGTRGFDSFSIVARLLPFLRAMGTMVASSACWMDKSAHPTYETVKRVLSRLLARKVFEANEQRVRRQLRDGRM